MRLVSLGSSRFPGDGFVQEGREAVGDGHRNKEVPSCDGALESGGAQARTSRP